MPVLVVPAAAEIPAVAEVAAAEVAAAVAAVPKPPLMPRAAAAFAPVQSPLPVLSVLHLNPHLEPLDHLGHLAW